jgi:hypothetical protein
MSLEAEIKALTEAMKENTAALKAGGGGKTSSGGTTKGSSGGKKATTLDQMAKRYGAYMAAEGDDAKANVRKVIKHFGVKKISEIDENQYDEALAFLDQFEAGDDPFGDDDDLM